VLQSSVLLAFESLIHIARTAFHPRAFAFFRPSDFDEKKNRSMLMLELVETELERLLKICLEKTIWVSRRHFGSVYSPQHFKSVNGDTAFSYKALKTSVIRTV